MGAEVPGQLLDSRWGAQQNAAKCCFLQLLATSSRLGRKLVGYRVFYLISAD